MTAFGASLWVGCVLAALIGGLGGAILIGQTPGGSPPEPRTVTVTVEILNTDGWYPLIPPVAGGGRPTEQR